MTPSLTGKDVIMCFSLLPSHHWSLAPWWGRAAAGWSTPLCGFLRSEPRSMLRPRCTHCSTQTERKHFRNASALQPQPRWCRQATASKRSLLKVSWSLCRIVRQTKRFWLCFHTWSKLVVVYIMDLCTGPVEPLCYLWLLLCKHML